MTRTQRSASPRRTLIVIKRVAGTIASATVLVERIIHHAAVVLVVGVVATAVVARTKGIRGGTVVVAGCVVGCIAVVVVPGCLVATVATATGLVDPLKKLTLLIGGR